MSRHPFRKSFGLIVLYSIIIIGIFVLQFRNESVLSRNTGLMSVSMAQTQNEDGSLSLKNTLKVAFKGISFTADEVYPATLIQKGSKQTVPLVLKSYEQPGPLSYKFNFSENTSVIFSVSDTTSQASLSVNAVLPENADALNINYKPSSGFSVTEKSKTRLQLNSKSLAYMFTASQISDENVSFTARNSSAFYSIYDPTITFTFASIDSDMAISQKSTYDANIRQFKSALIASVGNGIAASKAISEQSYIAYVAELASQGRFAEAVKYVPDSFKKGNKRTYLSAPYFNTLEAMYPSLAMHNENMANMISNAVATGSLNVFTAEGLAEYLNAVAGIDQVRSLLELPAQILSQGNYELSLAHASGILQVYVQLSELHSSHADILTSVLENCISVIENCCVLNDSTLTLVEKEQQASPQLTLEAGSSLIKLGNFNASEDYKKAGYALVNTVLAGTAFETNAMGEAYPVLVNNSFYPHFAVLNRNDAGNIWAWTCAPSLTYSLVNDVATISIKFNKGDSHYLIMSNVMPFSEIEIYGLSFHSDLRFETYNSSGFIYRENLKTLFLKTRQKADTEIVRLTFGKIKPAPAASAPAATPAAKPVEPVKPAEPETKPAEDNQETAEEDSEAESDE